MPIPDSLAAVASKVEATLARQSVRLTIGGEPTYVPIDPVGAEWNITALGPTKLRYGYALAEALARQFLPTSIAVLSPGKFYPGEVNARWAINLLWNRDGTPFVPALAQRSDRAITPEEFARAQAALSALIPEPRWMRGLDPADENRAIAVLPLDHDGTRFVSADWGLGETITLLNAEGSAGLRLPLNQVPAEVSRRALTIEILDDKLHIFLPPLLQGPVLAIIETITAALTTRHLTWAGYIPHDELGCWTKLAIAADPGVLEINLPPCATWTEYAEWLERLESAAGAAGLRSFKRQSSGEEAGTGGGNHLLLGGPSLAEHPLFSRPQWVTSILRFWQRHPSLSYLFTGIYVGPSSQAPRPDECVSSLYDLELAYQFLAQLGEGDHRYLISETLRHLHTDTSGNTHRSEISFDKFWNVNFDGGCRGLIEFRAIESLPRAEWMSTIALLWRTIAAYLLEHPCTSPLVPLGASLHDWYFLPAGLWSDFQSVLAELRGAGFDLPPAAFQPIVDWRFPTLLEHRDSGGALTIRKAHEGWPLLCEQPLEGGNTSRFVDTSIERLEFLADAPFAAISEVRVQGRLLPLEKLPNGHYGVGLRYRRTALYPSLHPGIPPHMPLLLSIATAGKKTVYRLESDQRQFTRVEADLAPADQPNACRKLQPELVTCDLRIA